MLIIIFIQEVWNTAQSLSSVSEKGTKFEHCFRPTCLQENSNLTNLLTNLQHFELETLATLTTQYLFLQQHSPHFRNFYKPCKLVQNSTKLEQCFRKLVCCTVSVSSSSKIWFWAVFQTSWANYTNEDICIDPDFETLVCICILFWKYVFNLCFGHCSVNAVCKCTCIT